MDTPTRSDTQQWALRHGRARVTARAGGPWRVVRSFAAAGLVLTVMLLLVGQATSLRVVGEFDSRLLDAVVGVRAGWAVSVARGASALADYAVVAIVAATAAGVGRWRSGTWRLAWLVAVSLGGSFVIAGVVKVLTERARPVGALVETTSASFPSGHTVRAMALYGLLAWILVPYPSRRSRVLAALAASAGLLSAASRVVLGAHWPTDVIAGVVLGVVWLAVTVRIIAPRLIVEPHPSGDRT